MIRNKKHGCVIWDEKQTENCVLINNKLLQKYQTSNADESAQKQKFNKKNRT